MIRFLSRLPAPPCPRRALRTPPQTAYRPPHPTVSGWRQAVLVHQADGASRTSTALLQPAALPAAAAPPAACPGPSHPAHARRAALAALPTSRFPAHLSGDAKGSCPWASPSSASGSHKRPATPLGCSCRAAHVAGAGGRRAGRDSCRCCTTVLPRGRAVPPPGPPRRLPAGCCAWPAARPDAAATSNLPAAATPAVFEDPKLREVQEARLLANWRDHAGARAFAASGPAGVQQAVRAAAACAHHCCFPGPHGWPLQGSGAGASQSRSMHTQPAAAWSSSHPAPAPALPQALP
jgi:hypothetical protein